MSSLVPVIGILFAAAITPGPNNVIVMEAGARSGIGAALVATVGVVAGSLLLLALVTVGVGAAVERWPAIQLALSIAGGMYLAWLGISLVMRSGSRVANAPGSALPATPLGIAMFQLLNPKAWILVTTAATAMPDMRDTSTLALLLVVVTTVCLALWGTAGALSARVLARPAARLWFDRGMGALMAIFAIGIAAEAVREWTRTLA